jgi:hypothetical protein
MPILDGADGKLTPKEASAIADRLMAHLFNVKTNYPCPATEQGEVGSD